jgi:hypothetical protein
MTCESLLPLPVGERRGEGLTGNLKSVLPRYEFAKERIHIAIKVRL